MPTKAQRLSEITEEVLARLTEIAQEQATIKEGSPDTQREKATLQSAANRVKALQSGRVELGQFVCVYCYLFEGAHHEMAPVPSDKSDVDLFRCHNCDDEIEVKA